MKHGYVKFALLTPHITLGAPGQNLENIKNALKTASGEGTEIAVLGKNALTGASIASMVGYAQVLDGALAALDELVKFSKEINCAVIVGLPLLIGDVPQSVAAVVASGKLCAIVPQKPPATESLVVLGQKYPLCLDALVHVELSDKTMVDNSFSLGIVFDEDFNLVNPIAQTLVLGGADIIVNLAASSATEYSFERKINRIVAASSRLLCGYVYVSTGFGEAVETCVYSGDKIAIELNERIMASEVDDDMIVYAELDCDDIKKRKILRGRHPLRLTPHIFLKLKSSSVALKRLPNALPFVPSEREFTRILNILARGVYTRMLEAKAQRLVLGLSGGLDSCMSLLIAEHMCIKYGLSKKEILAVMLPSKISSSRTRNNAKVLIDRLEVTGIEIPIGDAVESHLQLIDHDGRSDIVFENAQARERTQILLSLCNKYNAIMLGTGDLSEIALGWSTFGGDHLSHYNPIAGMAKTLVKAMIAHAAKNTTDKELSTALTDILGTPISPELLEGQDTEKLIGPYELHDFFLYNLIGKGFSIEKVFYLAKLTFKTHTSSDIVKYLRIFIQRFFTQQYKRTSAIGGIQISEFDLTNKTIHSEFNDEQYLKSIDGLKK